MPQGLSWRTEDRAQWARSAVGRGLSVVPWKSLRLSPDPRNTNPPGAQAAGLFLPPPRFCGPPSPVCPAGHPKVSAAQAAERAGCQLFALPHPSGARGWRRWGQVASACPSSLLPQGVEAKAVGLKPSEHALPRCAVRGITAFL